MAPRDAPPPEQPKHVKVAGGGPVGVGHPTFAEAAARLFDNGYEPLPIVPNTKKVVLPRWSSVDMDAALIGDWCAEYPHFGIGLRTGGLVGLDIDVLDAESAHKLHRLAIEHFGETLMRVGLWPKRLFAYRTATPFRKLKIGPIEALGLGQQFIAFGVHPDTRAPYYWPDGDTPLDVPLSDLPPVSHEGVEAFMAEARALLPDGPRPQRGVSGPPSTSQGPSRDDRGLVVDGRDGWLSTIAFHAVHDAANAQETRSLIPLTGLVWNRFAETADLERPKTKGCGRYTIADARRKVADKLRLLESGKLPKRTLDDVDAPQLAGALPLEDARAQLDEVMTKACADILQWHGRDDDEPAPQIGVRATVGLGKSVAFRHMLPKLQAGLKTLGAPSRVGIFTPSHALAEEAAEALRESGIAAVVHQGYERVRPTTGEAMCRDIDAVRIAIASGEPVRETVCVDQRGSRCAFFDGCAKQENVRAVSEADVVVAASAALFTGFAAETSSFGAIVIDEACWARARLRPDRIDLNSIPPGRLALGNVRGGANADAAAAADLQAVRDRLVAALRANGDGPLRRDAVRSMHLEADDCRYAGTLEAHRLRESGLRPGADRAARQSAAGVAKRNADAIVWTRLWRAVAAFLEGAADHSGRVRLEGEIVVVEGRRAIHKNLREAPVLHLDATLRPDAAQTVLPRLKTTVIDAATPHMRFRLITGAFGKGALIEDPRASEEENRRRGRKLSAAVAHVSWEARRVAPGRTLVITYKACEAAFGAIPGVETAHFNAVAGLDRWRDVALLIVMGRPLPSDRDLADLAGAMFDVAVEGGYQRSLSGVRMRSGRVAAVRTLSHEDERAESLRASICDDELIQAIGRGRGVMRTADHPLEVQVLADVALPLVHDSVSTWDLVAPDLLQSMLLAGVATSSPTDAASLHPDLFEGPNQAKKQFQAMGFKGRFPMYSSYRDLTLKSANYRLPGRGRGWTTAWWLDSDPSEMREAMTRALGPLAAWRPGGSER